MSDDQKQERCLVVANWKCNKSLDQCFAWFDVFARSYNPSDKLRVIIAPPLIWLAPLAGRVRELALEYVYLAAQDVSPFPPGSYTGAIAADMLKGVAEYCLAGHSERRRYFHETAQDVTNKISEAVDAGVMPIVCVDESYAMSQLTQLSDIDCEHLIIAYCPVDANTYREPESPEKVEEAARFISQVYPAQPIIYGGAIDPQNARKYADIDGIAGIFVGSASLEPEPFLDICREVGM